MYNLFKTEKTNKIELNQGGAYHKPPRDLLIKNNYEEATAPDLSEKIQNFYNNFRIKIEVVKRVESLAVVRYFAVTSEKISKITGLKNELILFLKISNILIDTENEAGAIVFEVPKTNRKTLDFLEILQDTPGLAVPFGVDLNGETVRVDIAKAPHLLIAGTTGSGKSCLINTIILNLLYNNTPDQVQFLMIDPKKVELSIYENIPHMITKPATTPEEAGAVLDFAIDEMLKRYETLKAAGVRSIQELNKNGQKMPYIIIIIDELADLLIAGTRTKLGADLTNTTKIDEKIARLAQMGRAAGVHIIAATQRPSREVLTGLIKANMPARVALSVANIYDSRVILDESGAENLTGRGDMFIKLPGQTKKRLQGAFISDTDTKKIIDYIIKGV